MDLDKLNFSIKNGFEAEKMVREDMALDLENKHLDKYIRDLGEITHSISAYIFCKNKYFPEEKLKESEIKYFNEHCPEHLKIEI